MKYRIYDDKGLIADANTENEAYIIFNDIMLKQNEYAGFVTSGDVVLVQELAISR